MPPKGKSGLSRSRDEIAEIRCPNCKHPKYPGEKPGDPCLAAVVYDPPRCSCTDHHKPKAGGGDS